MANIEDKVEELVKGEIEQLGYNLYDVQYVKEGQEYYLRIFIEKDNGSINLNDCEKVNDGINALLDEADYIKEQYFLEVSSTGLEKVLRKDVHLQDNIGNEIQLKLFMPIEVENTDNKKTKRKNNKVKEVRGKLESFNEKEIVIKEADTNQFLKVPRSNISLIKTVFDWDNI